MLFLFLFFKLAVKKGGWGEVLFYEALKLFKTYYAGLDYFDIAEDSRKISTSNSVFFYFFKYLSLYKEKKILTIKIF